MLSCNCVNSYRGIKVLFEFGATCYWKFEIVLYDAIVKIMLLARVSEQFFVCLKISICAQILELKFMPIIICNRQASQFTQMLLSTPFNLLLDQAALPSLLLCAHLLHHPPYFFCLLPLSDICIQIR